MQLPHFQVPPKRFYVTKSAWVGRSLGMSNGTLWRCMMVGGLYPWKLEVKTILQHADSHSTRLDWGLFQKCFSVTLFPDHFPPPWWNIV